MKKSLLIFCQAIVCLFLFTQVSAQEKITEWAQVLGSASLESIKGIVNDGDGNTYVTGSIEGTVNIVLADNTPLALNTTGLKDIYVAKINAAGKYVWVKTYGCDDGNDVGNKIKLDSNGDLIVVGEFASTVDFNTSDTNGGGIVVSKGGTDAFILKISALDGSFKWIKSLGGTSTENATGLSVDDSNNIFIGGRFGGTVDFDPGAGVSNLTQLSGSNSYNSYVLKLDVNGNFSWAKRIGGIDINTASNISIYDMYTANNRIYLTGRYRYGVNFNPQDTPAQTINSTKESSFILTLTDAGVYQWHRVITGTGTPSISAQGYGIAADNNGNVFSVGTYRESEVLPAKSGEATLEAPYSLAPATSNGDIYIIKFGADGKITWSKRIGLASEDVAEGVALDSKGDIYVTGRFAGANVDFGNSVLSSPGGQFDAFIVKIKNDGTTKWVHRIGGTSTELAGEDAAFLSKIDKGQAISVDQNYNIYTAGVFAGAAIFNLPDNPNIKYRTLGGDDAFIHKLGQPDVLPVNLVYFKVKRDLNQNNLSWQTLNETNNSHFILQRSTDGVHFNDIARVNGNGNSNSVNNYAYADSENFTGTIYYRLLQVDFNDKQAYSDVIYVKNKVKEVKIYPNPFSEKLTLKLEGNNGNISVRVIDAIGKTVYHEAKVTGSEIGLNLQSQPDGLYLIELKTGEDIEIYKVLKKANKNN